MSSMYFKSHVIPCALSTKSSASPTAVKIFGADLSLNGRVASI